MSRLAHKHAREAKKPSAHRNPGKKAVHGAKARAHANVKGIHSGSTKGASFFEVLKGGVDLLHGDTSAAIGNISGSLGDIARNPFTRRGGASSMSIGFGGRRRKRMNAGNVKALRRSMRRVQSFAHLAKQTMSFVQHHKLKTKRRKAR